MGKWATYNKRGSAQEFGVMAAPVSGDWTFTSPGVAQYSFNRVGGIPAPATKWAARIRVAASAWVQTGAQAATPITGAASSGATEFGQVAWFDTNGVQLSPWSDTKSVVIL